MRIWNEDKTGEKSLSIFIGQEWLVTRHFRETDTRQTDKGNMAIIDDILKAEYEHQIKKLAKQKPAVFTFKTGEFYTIEDIPETHRDMFLACSHQGACDSDVKEASRYFAVNDPIALANWLKEFGAWNDLELRDESANIERMLWLMSGAMHDENCAYIGI